MKKIFAIIIVTMIVFLNGCASKGKLVEITAEKAIEKLEHGDTFLFFVGRSDCPRCAEHIETLQGYMKSHPLTVYYVIQDRDENRDSFQKLWDTYFPGLEDIPATFYVKDGTIVKNQTVTQRLTEEGLVKWLERIGITLPNEG
ncbi:MAG: hypothetical protein II510_05000 [Erysipelotrichales bacterium]|nr:hypothetical protein [Erysipelotrichales bacterium]MBQ2310813.1 hypothetical protein [Erysipelotrichales bacterium]MBQ2478811.1 hypothetical protein [Erysipelotrichales bacterium]MBQ5542707.1 hypothetical protein [Erysipelotrichales bacterium]